MNTKILKSFTLVSSLALVGSAAQGATMVTDVLNEYGPGSYANVGGMVNPFTLYGGTMSYNYAKANQFGSLVPPTLTYFYPTTAAITSGVIGLTDAQGLSDVIVFGDYGNVNNQNFDYASFYSLDHLGALADQPYSGSTANLPLYPETGPYTPAVGQPGYVPGYTITYDFVSAVPESSATAWVGATFVLGALGLTSRRSLAKA